jgi:hypothetical protein
MNRLRPLEHWGRGFESHSGCRCLCLFCDVLCVGSDLTTGWSHVQRVQQRAVEPCRKTERVIRLQAGRQRSRSSIPCRDGTFFSFSQGSVRLWGPLNLQQNTYQGLFLRNTINQPGCKVSKPPEPGDEFESPWSYTSTSHEFSWHGG